MNEPVQIVRTHRPLSPRWLATILLLVFVSFGVATAESTGALSPTAARNFPEKSPWQRIVMIGASATAGFTASEPFGGTNTPLYKLSRYVDAALTVPHEPVNNLGNALFFFQPQLFAQQQLAQAMTNQPTLIIGVDFLFWFCYGEGSSDEARRQRFEQGLKLLEKVECPLIVGDLPDASAAVDVMLRPEQMPRLAAIAAANARLKEWAAGRSNVIVFGLSEFMRNATANHKISIHDYILPAGQTRMLLQADHLHPSPPGCAVLALALLNACQSTRPGIHTDAFRRDPKEIFRRVYKSPQTTPVHSSRTNAPAR